MFRFFQQVDHFENLNHPEKSHIFTKSALSKSAFFHCTQVYFKLVSGSQLPTIFNDNNVWVKLQATRDRNRSGKQRRGGSTEKRFPAMQRAGKILRKAVAKPAPKTGVALNSWSYNFHSWSSKLRNTNMLSSVFICFQQFQPLGQPDTDFFLIKKSPQVFGVPEGVRHREERLPGCGSSGRCSTSRKVKQLESQTVRELE